MCDLMVMGMMMYVYDGHGHGHSHNSHGHSHNSHGHGNGGVWWRLFALLPLPNPMDSVLSYMMCPYGDCCFKCVHLGHFMVICQRMVFFSGDT